MSYRELISIPAIRPFLAGMLIARIAQAMVGIAIVLFALSEYNSIFLAGIASFASIFPGLLVSPLAGALLDRHGRIRLVALDYAVALTMLVGIGVLALAGFMPAWLLIAIAALASLTAPLSATGLRSLLPLIVPPALWERVNAIDSTGYVVAIIIGPPLAAVMVALWGAPVTFIAIGVSYGIAAFIVARLREPQTATQSSGSLLRDSWLGLVYTWRNPVLRGLGFCISTVNLGYGAMTIIVPVLIRNRYGMSEAVVGLVFALQGLAGVAAAFVSGSYDTRGRERRMLIVTMLLAGAVTSLLLANSELAMLALVMALLGILNGPMDIALFTLRQRRTDPSWMGRAFAVSMSFNYTGIPIGAAIAGAVATASIEAAILFSALATFAGGVIAALSLPRSAAAGGQPA